MMTPTTEQKERYDRVCRQMWGELNEVVVKYMKANEDIDAMLALGALTAELVYVIHRSFEGDDQMKLLEQYCASMRLGLKQTQTVAALKAVCFGGEP